MLTMAIPALNSLYSISKSVNIFMSPSQHYIGGLLLEYLQLQSLLTSVMSHIIFIFSFLSLAIFSVAYPNGAPQAACESLTPGHGTPPSQQPNPYTLDVNLTLFSGMPLYSVRLAATSTPFRGFILQAESSTGEALGMLLPDGRGMSQELNCSWPILNTLTKGSL